MELKLHKKKFEIHNLLIPSVDSDSIYETIPEHKVIEKHHARIYSKSQGVISYERKGTRSFPVKKSLATWKWELENDNQFLTRQNIIEDTIEESKYILDLPYNWDDEGAIKVSEEAFNICTSFLRNYNDYILDTFNIQISSPEINAVNNGTLDLYWNLPNARMLINLDQNSAKYYGDEFYNKNSIKGEVDLFEVQSFLGSWMTKLK